MTKAKEERKKNGEHSSNLVPIMKPPQDLTSVPTNESAAAFLDENRGERTVPDKIPVITIDHKSAGFVLPNGETREAIAGYPILYFQTRKFYEKPPMPGAKGQPPDCWSADLIVPHVTAPKKQDGGKGCAECKQAQWGSGRDGRSQACSTMTWVFLLNPVFGNPPLALLIVPPSSIRILMGTKFKGGYFAQAAAKHGVYEIVWSELRLQVEGDQVEYCTLVPVMGPAATPENARVIAVLRNRFFEMMKGLRGSMPDPELKKDTETIQ